MGEDIVSSLSKDGGLLSRQRVASHILFVYFMTIFILYDEDGLWGNMLI